MINFGASAIMRWYTNNTSVTEDKYGNKMFGKVEPKLRKMMGSWLLMLQCSAKMSWKFK